MASHHSTSKRKPVSAATNPPFGGEGRERTELYCGTSGYAYKEWSGSFYPAQLSNQDWLTYYASQLHSVEINNTFYRMPKTHVVEQWCEQVPAHFRFVFKASRRISHQKRLKDVEEATEYLGKRALTFGAKLGCILLQLPSNMPNNPERLQRFIELLPPGVRCAFEFRHASWEIDDIDALLREAGHTRVISDVEDGPKVASLGEFEWYYLRLRRERYTAPSLKRWARLIQASGAARSYVYFKHEDAGAGPRLATRFTELYHQAELNRTPRPQRAPRKR